MKYSIVIILMTFIFSSINNFISHSQCSGFPTTLAETTCGTGNQLVNNANINSGTLFTFCGTTSTTVNLNNVNLNGGQLTICGNVSLQGSWNSGEMIISCGSTVNFPSGLLLNNNVKIVNYGTVNVTGDLNFQNNNNSFFNEADNSRLNVSANIIFAQNNGQNGYLKNNGYISAGGNLNLLNGGFVCFGSFGKMDVTSIQYGTGCGTNDNRVTYSGITTSTGIIKYTGNANLYGRFTNDTRISINKVGAASQTFSCGAASNWGNAVVTNNTPNFLITPQTICTTPNCFSTLAVELDYFDIESSGNGVALLRWKTNSERNNDYFKLSYSQNGESWFPISTINGAGSSNEPQLYEQKFEIDNYETYYFLLSQTDYNGSITVFPIIKYQKLKTNSNLIPNPSNSFITVCSNDILSLEICTINGNKVTDFSQSKNIHSTLLNVQNLDNGIYFLTIQKSDQTFERLKFEIQKN